MNITDSKHIWCKIRYYQHLYGISNEQLAKTINIKPRTLSSYDKSSQNLTLGQIDSFLSEYSLTMEELLS